MANPTLQKQFGALPAANAAADQTLSTATTPVTMGAEVPMTLAGTAIKTAFLLALVLGAGAWGWTLVDPDAATIAIPGWWWLVLIGAVILAIVTSFRPQLAIVTGPLYAVAQGVVVGAISHIYEAEFEGIIIQALLAAASVFMVMLVLFVTRTIRVTSRMRGVIIGATAGIALFYLVSIVLALFGVTMPFVWDSGPFGILFSILVVGIAAFNLMLDFDLIERAVTARAPRVMEWFGAFALMVTIVWLYIEILRLIAKVRD
ncbi:MAG: Bax inhibitor-1/YccA family protein [Acidimicrobiia bacterium]